MNPPNEAPRAVESIASEIEAIDVALIDTRFKSFDNLSQTQIVTKLSELIEKRNSLMDELNKAKSNEFHDFINSLNLKDLQITPFFPVPRRCKLQLNNPASTELIKIHDAGGESNNPWKKMLSSFMKKKEEEKQMQARSAIGSLYTQQQRIISEKKIEIQNEIQKLTRKTILSPTDIALKLRLESEFDELEKFEIRKRKAK